MAKNNRVANQKRLKRRLARSTSNSNNNDTDMNHTNAGTGASTGISIKLIFIVSVLFCLNNIRNESKSTTGIFMSMNDLNNVIDLPSYKTAATATAAFYYISNDTNTDTKTTGNSTITDFLSQQPDSKIKNKNSNREHIILGSAMLSTRSDSKDEPAWPQQDNSILDAIQMGHRIDANQTPTIDGTHYLYNTVKCESPPKGMATIVTAYYDMSSKHPQQQYKEWIGNLMKATDPMIIFVDPIGYNEDWVKFMKKRRQHAPTLLVPLPFQNFTMSTTFSNIFWNKYILPRDRTKSRMKKNSDVYKIWNEKIIFLREATRANPFETEFFYWIDSGYYRRNNYGKPKYTPIVRNNITEQGVEGTHQLVYQMIKEYPDYTIAGGAWGGTASAIQLHYYYYWKTFWYLTLYSDKECVGFEQRVMVWMCRSFPKSCVIRKSRNWFTMGTVWLQSPGSNFTETTYQIPKDNTTTVPLLTENFNITFPKGSNIRVVHEIPKGSLSLERKMNYSHFIIQKAPKTTQQKERRKWIRDQQRQHQQPTQQQTQIEIDKKDHNYTLHPATKKIINSNNSNNNTTNSNSNGS